MERLGNPEPDQETQHRLGELLLSLMKPDTSVYIDIYPIDPANPTEYTYEYWEVKNRAGMEDFRNGTE